MTGEAVLKPKADLMLSHSWREDMEEMQGAVRRTYSNSAVNGLSLDMDTTLWFCCFAQYQVGDQYGPSVEEQLRLRPFETVIMDVKVMVAVHTTKDDLYSRLWCVHELSVAM